MAAQILGDLRGLLAGPDPDAYSTRTRKDRTSRHPVASVQAAVLDPAGGEDGLVLEELVQAADRDAVFAGYGSERQLGVRKVTDVLGGRRALERAQSGRAVLRETDDERMTVPGGPTGGVPVRIIRPRDPTAVLPVVLYLHGPGWMFGGLPAVHALVRGAPPGRQGLDGTWMAVAGNAAGGNPAAALTLPAKERGDVRFAHQVLFRVSCLGVTHDFVTLVALCDSQAAASAIALACDTLHSPS